VRVSRAMDISASGLAAQRARMDIIAENLANAGTTRTLEGGAYRRKRVILAADPGDSEPLALPAPLESSQARGGVRVVGIEEDPSPFPLVYEPNHPDARPDGYVEMPNVNIVTEMVDMIAATRAYEANAAVVSAVKQMAHKALEIAR
jgi:flagellar basal-body rod protein FlgC